MFLSFSFQCATFPAPRRLQLTRERCVVHVCLCAFFFCPWVLLLLFVHLPLGFTTMACGKNVFEENVCGPHPRLCDERVNVRPRSTTPRLLPLAVGEPLPAASSIKRNWKTISSVFFIFSLLCLPQLAVYQMLNKMSK